MAGNTDLGHGIGVALDLLDQPGTCATQRVTDVSGDGRETVHSRRSSILLSEVRERAHEMGVQINGLAVALCPAAPLILGRPRPKAAVVA